MDLSRRTALLLLAALPAACASTNPSLYVLAVEPGAVRTGAPRTISVRPVALAHYLERQQIVRSSDGYRIETLPNEWWGEPLDAMMARVLVEELNQRLPGSTAYADNGAISAPAGVAVEVNLQRMDLDAQGAVKLAAQVATDRKSATVHSLVFSVRPSGPATRELVAAMSAATGQLADAIAAILAGG